MKFKITSIIFIILMFIPSWAISETPKRSGNTIGFSSGIELLISPRVVVEPDPLKANEKGIPNEILQEAFIVDEWERVIILTTRVYFEESKKTIDILDYSGRDVGLGLTFIGDLIPLIKHRILVLAQYSSHYEIGASYLVDPDGWILKKLAIMVMSSSGKLLRMGLFFGLYLE